MVEPGIKRILEPFIAVLDEVAVILLLLVIGLSYLVDRGYIGVQTALLSIALFLGFAVFASYKALKSHMERAKVGKESLVGAKGRVMEDLDPEGFILVEGEIWRAESIDGSKIPKGSRVIVRSVKGMRLLVEKVREDELV